MTTEPDAPRDAERLARIRHFVSAYAEHIRGDPEQDGTYIGDEAFLLRLLTVSDATIRDLRAENERLTAEREAAVRIIAAEMAARPQPATPSPLLDIPPECDPNCTDPECPYIHQWTSSRTASDGGPSEENHLHLSMWERVTAARQDAGEGEPGWFLRDVQKAAGRVAQWDGEHKAESDIAALSAARAEGHVIIGEPEAPTDDIDRLLFAIHYELSWDEAREKIAARFAEGERAMRARAEHQLRSHAYGHAADLVRALPTTEKSSP